MSQTSQTPLFSQDRGANVEWMSQLELLEARVYPLPGGSVRRGTSLDVDSRLSVQSPLSTDVMTFYEHVASIRHKPSGRIYVAFRETMDALLMRQNDPEKYPSWLMHHPVKKTELHIHILQAKANPKPIMAAKGMSEVWFKQWLQEIEEDWIHETLAFYLLSNRFVKEEMFAKG